MCNEESANLIREAMPITIRWAEHKEEMAKKYQVDPLCVSNNIVERHMVFWTAVAAKNPVGIDVGIDLFESCLFLIKAIKELETAPRPCCCAPWTSLKVANINDMFLEIRNQITSQMSALSSVSSVPSSSSTPPTETPVPPPSL